MAAVPSENVILSAARPLVEAGVALHWLRRREKAPIEDKWSTAAVHTLESLTAAYRSGSNIGVRLGEPSRVPGGYLYLLDFDIRDAALVGEALAALRQLWPDAESAPFVVSGSGGESRHFYFVSPGLFRSRKLLRSAGFSFVFDEKKQREVKKFDWEIELYGTGKQVVLPPSIHPVTGEPYVWGRSIDFDLLNFGIGPILSAEKVESWGVSEDDLALDDSDDLFSLVRTSPMGLSDDVIDQTLADLPDWWVEDRDTWLQVGQALSHEHEGSQIGFERWCEWSKRSSKYDVQDQKTVWKSFKGAKNPVRMATLIKAAGDHRLAQAHADLESLLAPDPTDPTDLFDEPTPGTSLALIPDDIAALLGPTDAGDLSDLIDTSPSPASPPKPEIVVDPDWRSWLQRNEEGVIKPTLPNVQLIVRNDIRTRGIIAFNKFTQDVVLIRSPGSKSLKKASPKPIRQLDGEIWEVRDAINGDLWTDSHDHAVRAILEAPERQGGYGLKTSDRDMKAAVDMVAHENAFHPVRDYLESVEWDGTPRVERLFIDYLGSPDTAYHRATARLALLGAVTRIFEPGHKFDFVPILEGVQGKRKSTFIEILACNWFAELEGDLHDRKQLVEKMQGSWIMEIPELQGFNKAEVTTIKGFVSARSDKVRLAYGRRATVFLRQQVFWGSTNDSEYLRDASGGRRFWPVHCTIDEIDTERLKREVNQLWAEAVVLYRELRRKTNSDVLPLYLVDEETRTEASLIQESRRAESAEEGLAGRIEHWVNKPIGSELGFDEVDGDAPQFRDQVCVRDVWIDLLGRDEAQLDQRHIQVVSKALQSIPGWYAAGRKTTAKYGRQRVIRRNGVTFLD